MMWPRTSLACLHCCGRAKGILPGRTLLSKDGTPASILRSLRLRHPTGSPGEVRPCGSPPHPPPAPACQRAAPRAVTTFGSADAAVPLHPLHPAARTTLGGRSSQSPQMLPRLSPPCQGLGTGLLGTLPFPRGDATKERPPISRETLSTASTCVQEPHHCTTTTLLCQVVSRGALFAPRLA